MDDCIGHQTTIVLNNEVEHSHPALDIFSNALAARVVGQGEPNGIC